MGRIVFTGGNVLDVEHGSLVQRTVVLEGNRITSVRAAHDVTPRADDRTIDLAGATLMPGMVQAHWHGTYAGLDFEPPPVGLEKPAGYLMLLAAKHARMALERGFTSVIGAASGDAIDAQLKAAIEDGVLDGPRIVPCGRWLITTGDSNDLPNFWWWGITSPGSQRICDGPDEFRKAVRQEIKEGAEILKIFADSGHALLYGSEFVSMTEAELRAVVEAAHDRGKKVRCHVTAKRMILRCIAAGVDVLDHADGMDDECIEAIVKAGAFVCPSLYLPKAMLAMIRAQGQGKENEPFFVAMQRDFDHMCEVLPRAESAGVKLMVGDDWGTIMTPHGDYAKELELYVNDAGIDARAVLRWATVHAAECMGRGADLGAIAAGRLADFVAIDGDPTRDISVLADPDNVRFVVKDGKIVKDAGPARSASRLRAAN
jgi:imidazolonepropionase-like amidohydrolase